MILELNVLFIYNLIDTLLSAFESQLILIISPVSNDSPPLGFSTVIYSEGPAVYVPSIADGQLPPGQR